MLEVLAVSKDIIARNLRCTDSHIFENCQNSLGGVYILAMVADHFEIFGMYTCLKPN